MDDKPYESSLTKAERRGAPVTITFDLRGVEEVTELVRFVGAVREHWIPKLPADEQHRARVDLEAVLRRFHAEPA